MIECSKKVRSVCPYRKTCGGGVYKEGSACDKFAESLQNKKAHKPGVGLITREQVEKMRGKWIDTRYSSKDVPKCQCSICGKKYIGLETDFCQYCGAPMTDKAVDILWKRLEEALKDGKGD